MAGDQSRDHGRYEAVPRHPNGAVIQGVPIAEVPAQVREHWGQGLRGDRRIRSREHDHDRRVELGQEMLITQEPDGRWRKITRLEAERLQNFPDGWTDGATTADAWFALGNAVNCAVSKYLFTEYLPSVGWWKV